MKPLLALAYLGGTTQIGPFDCLHWRQWHATVTLGHNSMRNNTSNSNTEQYLPWPPWSERREIETILSVSCRPRWPRQVLFCVDVAGVIAHTLPMETRLKSVVCGQGKWGWQKHQQYLQRQRHNTVLALATLGSMTGLFLFILALPKVAKASTVLCHCHWCYCAYFANGNTA